MESNILRDQVKVYSKWPTYPQLFLVGELIGGSDILHEMHKDQSLQKLLQEKGLIWYAVKLNVVIVYYFISKINRKLVF